MGMKEFNKQIRQKLYPILREIGFERIGNRNSLIWKADVIYRLQIKAVGSYFRDVTGWPSGSFSCSVNPYYGFLNDLSEKDNIGKLIPPKRWPTDGGLGLSVAIDQSQYTNKLKNLAERERTDLWWLEDDESNVNNAVDDLVFQVVQKVPGYLRNDLELTYQSRRDFFPPNEQKMQNYIEEVASKEGAIFHLKMMIKFSNYLNQKDDKNAYEDLLGGIIC